MESAMSRGGIKVQALADFITECSTPFPKNKQQEEPTATWMLDVDGSATSEGRRVGLLSFRQKGMCMNMR